MSETQIAQFRKTWARRKLIAAWHHVDRAVKAGAPTAELLKLDRKLTEAGAIAQEWGIDPQRALEDEQRARAEAVGDRRE